MVRVRIAPSPTGFAHIGLARTALFNYLFAKKNKGVFVLRIEDTDKERSKKEYEDAILASLKWLGVHWDEGPDIGGAFGPYRQSERGHIYQEYLEKLARDNRLYKCYCSKEDLEQEKQELTLAKLPPRYSGKCKKLTESERHKMETEKREYTLRFCLEPQLITIQDIVRGTVVFDTALMDDFIIAKDFDTPLYNFAVVIDDALMNISHVIRGEEHISNTPRQIQLAQALGLAIPQFGHLPLILDSDRKKMSKREHKTAIDEYKVDGYLPEALLNFIALLGWNPGGEKELFSLNELESIFDIDQVNKSGSIFDVQKLDWFNGCYIRQLECATITDLLIPYLIAGGLITQTDKGYRICATGEPISREQLERIVLVERGRIRKLADISSHSEYYFLAELNYTGDLLQWKESSFENIRENLMFSSAILKSQQEDEWNPQKLEERFRQEILTAGKKNGEVLWPLRVCLSGQKASPSPYEIAWIIGKKAADQRINQALRKIKDI